MSLEDEQRKLKESIPEIVHEFIGKIVVSKPVYIDGKRHETLDIYCNGVGILTMTTPEKMEEEFEYRMKQQGLQTTKTA